MLCSYLHKGGEYYAAKAERKFNFGGGGGGKKMPEVEASMGVWGYVLQKCISFLLETGGGGEGGGGLQLPNPSCYGCFRSDP